MKRQKGEALIEAIIALTVVTLIISAVVMAVITSLNSSDFSEDQNKATNYAQEGIEILRDKKSSDFSAFTGILDRNWCLDSGSTALTPYSGCDGPTDYNIEGKYTRSVYINDGGDDSAGNQVCVSANTTYVASTVVWTDSKCNSGANCHKVQYASCFANTNALPNP